MENLEIITDKNKASDMIKRPEECPKCGSIFINYQNGKLKCLIRKCSYTFSFNMIKKNGKLIGYYS